VGGRATVALGVLVAASACLQKTPGYEEGGAEGASDGGTTGGATTTTDADETTDATASGATDTASTTQSPGTSATATGPSCAAEDYGGHTYLFCVSGSAWVEAQASCETEGMNLATIDDAAEDGWLFDTVNSHDAGRWWFGYNDRTDEGTWEWVDGTPQGYENWEASEPNDANDGEDCAQLNRFPTGEWNDEACDIVYAFVCESG
jgi:hypothetical protein